MYTKHTTELPCFILLRIPVKCTYTTLFTVPLYIYIYIYYVFCIPSFIHLSVCLSTGPKPLQKWAHHIVRSRASSFEWEYRLLSLRSSSSFLRLLPRLPVTSIPPFIFRSITPCRRQFPHKMWPIHLAFRLLISCRIFLCSLLQVVTDDAASGIRGILYYIMYYILCTIYCRVEKCRRPNI